MSDPRACNVRTQRGGGSTECIGPAAYKLTSTTNPEVIVYACSHHRHTTYRAAIDAGEWAVQDVR